MVAPSAASAVEWILMPGFLIAGLSHILQPGMWMEFFRRLHDMGTSGLVLKIFALELWPALAIVTLHPVWSGPGIVLTLYGWALLAKCTLGLTMPSLGMRGMAMAERGPRNFVVGGVALVGMAGVCLAAVLTAP